MSSNQRRDTLTQARSTNLLYRTTGLYIRVIRVDIAAGGVAVRAVRGSTMGSGRQVIKLRRGENGKVRNRRAP